MNRPTSQPDLRANFAASAPLPLIALFMLAIYGLDLESRQILWLTDIAWTLAALGAGIKCWATARRMKGADRRAWMCFAAGCGSWLLGMLIWDYYELVLGIVTPFPTLADPAFLGLAPLFAAGIVQYRAGRLTRSLTIAQICNLGIITAGVFMIMTLALYQPIREHATSSLTVVTAIAWPVVFISAFLFGAASLWLHMQGPKRRVLHLIVISLGSHALVSASFAHDILSNIYSSGNAESVVWLIAFSAVYAAAVTQKQLGDSVPPVRSAPALRSARQWETLVAAFTGLGIVTAIYLFRDNLEAGLLPYLLPAGIALSFFLGLREWLAFRVESALRRSAEETAAVLQENERSLSLILDSAIEAIITIDRAGRILSFNAAAEQIFGYSRSQIVGREMAELIIPERDRDRHRQGMARYLATRRGTIIGRRVETTAMRADGSEFPIELSITCSEAQDHEATLQFTAFIRDIAARREAEANQRRLVAILEATPDFVGISTVDRKPLYINRAGRRLLGIGEDEDVTRISLSSMHSDGTRGLIGTVGLPAALRDGIWTGENVLLARNGQEIPVSQVILTHRNSTGEVRYVSTICRDISERKAAAATERRLLAALEESSEGYALFDPDDRLVFANREYRRLLSDIEHLLVPGADIETILRAAAEHGHFSAQSSDGAEWAQKRLAEHRSSQDTTEVQRGTDGNWMRIRQQLLPDGSVFLVRTDISAEKAREGQLIQAQKMEAVGQLTGGIAHDFNNLLAVIQGNLELIAEREGLGPAVDKFTGPALRAAQRGAELTQRLLAFSRRQMLRPQFSDINALVTDMAELLRRTLGGNIEIEMDLADSAWPTHVDTGQLENALLNLALNARDAMLEGGRLTIGTKNVELGPEDVEGDAEAGQFVALTVEDTGHGMPPEVLARVYEPFFTTKDAGRGSGLGLSMVYGFVKQTGGHMRIESSPGGGTRVTIRLPRATAAGAAAAAAESRHAVPPRGQGETVLVVEDDAEVRNLVVRQLTELGYRVREAGQAAAALAVMDDGPDVDLLLTDIVLPGGKSGISLIKTIRERFPELRMLCMSGYAQEAMTAEDARMLGADLLHKPFRRAELARAVRNALDGQALR